MSIEFDPSGDERLRIGSIGEMFADGGFTGPTAYTLNDYKGMPGFRGRAMLTPEQMRANIEAGHKLGWQFGIHAIGDAAIDRVLRRKIGSALKKRFGKKRSAPSTKPRKNPFRRAILLRTKRGPL